MFDCIISKEVIVESRKQIVLSLPGIRGICPYAPFSSLATVQVDNIVPKEAYYCAYVYDIGDDRVYEASEMFREWKSSKRMDKDTITLDRFNAGYDKGYKELLNKGIQNVSSQTPRSFRSITDKKAKEVAELQEVNKEAQELYAKFVENQDTLRG